MDSIDYKILSYLRSNARENATVIGAKINLSTSAVIERIKKLENAGVIKQYTTIFDQKTLGRDLMVFINVRLEHPKFYESFVDTINESKYVVESHYIAGDFDFILKVIASNSKELEEILNSIKSIKGVSMTRTSVVLSTNKCEVSFLPQITNK